LIHGRGKYELGSGALTFKSIISSFFGEIYSILHLSSEAMNFIVLKKHQSI